MELMDFWASGLEHKFYTEAAMSLEVVVCSVPFFCLCFIQLLYGFLSTGNRGCLACISGPTLARLSLGSAGDFTYPLYGTHMSVTCCVMA